MNLDLTSWSIQSKNGMKTNRFKSVTGGDARTLFLSLHCKLYQIKRQYFF